MLVPISYAQPGSTLRGYKDAAFEAARWEFGSRLTAVLSRFLDDHERCVARATGVEAFDLLTVVPRSTPEHDKERRDCVRWSISLSVCEHPARRASSG